jgi:hypothetical protein
MAPIARTCEKIRLCRLLCGKAQRFGPSSLKKKNNKPFRLGRLPESRRLSAQQAVEPQQPQLLLEGDFFTRS